MPQVMDVVASLNDRVVNDGAGQVDPGLDIFVDGLQGIKVDADLLGVA